METRESSMKESLRSLFEDLGCKINSDDVLDKCFELCGNYVDVDLEKLTELWLTFCINNDLGIDPTVNNLNKLERSLLKECASAGPVEKMKREHSIVKKQNAEYNKNDDVLSMYGCAEAGPSKGMQINHEVELYPNIQAGKTVVPEHSFSLVSLTEQLSVPSQRSTTDRGKILFSIGESIKSWKRTNEYNVKVTRANTQHHVSSEMKYMYEILSNEGEVRTYVCKNIGSKLFSTWCHAALEAEAPLNSTLLRYVKNVRTLNQTNFRTFGRINVKRKSANTVTLEGSTRRNGMSAADLMEMDFRDLKQYSLFSGQIVSVEAINPLGDTLYVKNLLAHSYAQPAAKPRLCSALNVFVGAGPFTMSNSMGYQPLWDLMEKVASDEPQLLILIGPFLEYMHHDIQQNNTIKDTHQELFDSILIKIMESTGNNTQVVLISSERDVHHEPVFPTPEYTVVNRKLHSYSNLKMMPDPCILDVDGLKIGVTSVDVIKHIGKEEVSNVSGDRLRRLADHVLGQACFYPVYPPVDLNVKTDEWAKCAFFDEQPHLLILPSDMRYFCKSINECIVINPDRMYKNTYARIRVKSSGIPWTSGNVSCEIVKV